MSVEIIYTIEQKRIEIGMSKSELSRLTGISFNQVSGLLNNKRNVSPKLSTLSKYAEAMKCNVKDLFIEKSIEDASTENN